MKWGGGSAQTPARGAAPGPKPCPWLESLCRPISRPAGDWVRLSGSPHSRIPRRLLRHSSCAPSRHQLLSPLPQPWISWPPDVTILPTISQRCSETPRGRVERPLEPPSWLINQRAKRARGVAVGRLGKRALTRSLTCSQHETGSLLAALHLWGPVTTVWSLTSLQLGCPPSFFLSVWWTSRTPFFVPISDSVHLTFVTF